MSLMPSYEEQELLADTFRRAVSRMAGREKAGEALVAIAFAGAVAALWSLDPPHHVNLLPALLCLLVLSLATRVKFDTGLGYTVATQLAFVPFLFAVPVVMAPLGMLCALVLAELPGVLRRRARPRKLFMAIGNSWFTVGPVAVFVLAGTSPRAAGAALLLGALGAQFAVDFALSALRFWIDREANLTLQLRETWVYAIDAGMSGMALAVAEAIPRTPIAALAPLPMLGLLAVFARERHDRIESLLELNTAYRGTALVLGDVVEADDSYTGEHCRGVVALALDVGKSLGLGAERLRNLEFGALLHDVGKIAVPKEIINKPGKLDPHEWKIIETHTIEGQKMLDRIGGFMRSVGLIVRSHHERWDGSGYPDGLAGEAIPLEARIISCCDAWNAMRTDRAYRKALPHDAAVAELLGGAGHQFDPAIVDVTLGVIGNPGDRPGQ
jgi:putative nucleotidyltransferase with HDIG domain